MLVKYEGKEYNFDLDDVTVRQLQVLYAHLGGMTLAALEDGIRVGDPNALTGVFWLMLENNGESVPLEQIDFKVVKFFRCLQEAAFRETQDREETAKREAAEKRQKKDEAPSQ